MADTFNNDLRVREQEAGSNSGTWGGLLNTTISNLASAFGQGSEAIPNASTHTITLADGTADEARSMYLKCTGGGQACTVTLAPNTISKVWIISNETSHTLTFSQGSGANVAVAAGAVKMIVTDGAGSGAAVTDALSGLSANVSDVTTTGNISFGDNDKAIFGAGSDLQIYHDGLNSYIVDAGTGDLYFRSASNLYIGNAAGTQSYITATDGGAVDLRYNGSAKLATTSTGIDVTGVITTDGMTTSADINFGDNDKAIFGAGSDLQIYHDGNDSYVQDSGTGLLFIRGSSSVRIQGANGESSIDANENGAVNLYYDNSNKLSTTSTGIDVTGSVVSDGLTVSNSSLQVKLEELDGTYNPRLVTYFDSSGTHLQHTWSSGADSLFLESGGSEGSGTKALGIQGGDISFYEDTGTTPKMFWDASAESLGIGQGVFSSGQALNLKGAGIAIKNDLSGSNNNWSVIRNTATSSESNISFVSGAGEAMVIDHNKNVGIGATPDALLRVNGTAKIGEGAASNTAKLMVNTASGTAAGIQLFQDGNESWIIQNPASTTVLTFANSGTERMRIRSSGELLVGKTSTGDYVTGIEMQPAGAILSYRNGGVASIFGRTNSGEITRYTSGGSIVGTIGSTSGTLWIGSGDVGLVFDNATSNSEQIRPYNTASGTRDAAIDLGNSTGRFKDLYLSSKTKYQASGGNQHSVGVDANDLVIRSETAGSETARFTYGGNFLVSKTAVSTSTVGVELRETGKGMFTASGTDPLFVNRLSSDGAMLKFSKDNGDVGSIGASGGDIFVGTGDTGLRFVDFDDAIVPWNTDTNAGRDNAIDLGKTAERFDDIYATNGTIQTSDRNEKQDIEALSDAEQRVAVAAKGLLRKFRWISSVEENGDDARIHFGIIAQDLQDAFTAEGLDAGRYAMFINSTWTDEETGEERTRMGVRYSELLAFIIAAI